MTPNLVTKINVCLVCVCQNTGKLKLDVLFVATLHLFGLNCLFLFCHNTAPMLCLALGTKTTWLGSESNQVWL